MSRPLQSEYENAFHHVITWGERRDAIFSCAGDKDKFLIKLGETAEKYQLLVNANDIIEIMIVNRRIVEEDLWKRRHGNVYRKLLIYGLRRHTANSLWEIGQIMKMDYSAVSALARRFEKEKKRTKPAGVWRSIWPKKS